MTTLGEVTEQVRREHRVVEGRSYDLLGVRWYGEGPFKREVGVGGEIKATRLFAVEPGDFIYNRLFAWKGSFGVVPETLGGSYVSGEFPLFSVDSGAALVEFINLAMCRPSVWSSVERESTGSTATSRNRWKEERFARWELMLPPLEEQHRIVDLIAAVNEAIDAAGQGDSAAHGFNQARQDGKDEQGTDSTLVELGEIAEVKGGITKDSKRQADPDLVRLPYLRVANVQRGFLDLTNMAEIGVAPARAEELRLQTGDVLLNEGGDRDKLGRGWVWEGQVPNCIHQNHVFRARLRDDAFDPYYVAILTNSRAGQRWFEENGSQTTNLASINVNTIRRFPVPALSRPEQHEVVALHMAAREFGRRAEEEGRLLTQLRSALLDDLLSGEHEIPASYDELLGV